MTFAVSLRLKVPSRLFFSSISIDIEEAKEIFEECFDKLIALSAKAKNPKNVYYAGIQFVSVSKGDKK